MNINEKTLAFLRDCYEQRVDTLLDDPDEVCQNADEMAAYIVDLVEIGNDIGTSFYSVAKKSDYGTSHLIEVWIDFKSRRALAETDQLQKATNALRELE